ncbi:hypothetical protein HZ326_12457 [Fusarium oxysporum f. sp. albedinis]|nr:hypothetical protein HZ326_12457 [Fusarium oxysporum f. sp. albedinis]
MNERAMSYKRTAQLKVQPRSSKKSKPNQVKSRTINRLSDQAKRVQASTKNLELPQAQLARFSSDVVPIWWGNDPLRGFYKWQNHKYRSASPYPAKRDQSKDQRGQVQSIDKRYSARAKLYQHIRSSAYILYQPW